MKPHVQRVHSALRIAIPIFAIVCLLGVAAIHFSFFSSPAHAASTVHGCPPGYVCIYPQNAGWNGDSPALKYYNYGTYQLQNQYGYHYVFNNQTGEAWLQECTDWNGQTCPWIIAASDSYNQDLTPVNSIRLAQSLY